MNKITVAWSVLQSLPLREQDVAVEAILDYAAALAAPGLSDVQAQEIEQRLRDADESTLTPAELRLRIEKILP